jgi:hypothetical protein
LIKMLSLRILMIIIITVICTLNDNDEDKAVINVDAKNVYTLFVNDIDKLMWMLILLILNDDDHNKFLNYLNNDEIMIFMIMMRIRYLSYAVDDDDNNGNCESLYDCDLDDIDHFSDSSNLSILNVYSIDDDDK